MFFQTYHQLNKDTIVGSLDKALFIVLGIVFIIVGGDIVSLGEAKGHNEPVLIVGQVLYVGDDFPFFSVSTGDEEFICERWAYSNENNRDECHGDTFIVEESVGTISYCRIFEGND
jgi:hypothetical protein